MKIINKAAILIALSLTIVTAAQADGYMNANGQQFDQNGNPVNQGQNNPYGAPIQQGQYGQTMYQYNDAQLQQQQQLAFQQQQQMNQLKMQQQQPYSQNSGGQQGNSQGTDPVAAIMGLLTR